MEEMPEGSRAHEPHDEQGWIELYRGNHGWVDRKTPVDLIVNEISRGGVLPYERLQVPVEPGSYRVQIASVDGWSNELDVVVKADEVIHLKVTSLPGAAWFNPLLLGRAVHMRLRITKPG